MEIVYCENCGTRIPEADIDSGKAAKSGTDCFCPECTMKLGIKPDPPKPQVSRKTPRPTPRVRGPTRTPSRGVQSAGSARSRGARQQPGSARGTRQPQARQGTMMLAAGAGLVAFALTLVVILVLGGKKKRRKREERPPETPVPVSVPAAEPEPREPASLFAPRRTPGGTRAPLPPARPIPPAPPPPVAPAPPDAAEETAGPDLEEAKQAGEDWLKNRAGASPKPYLEAPRASRPPVIDGELEDACWKKAARSTVFTWGPDNLSVPEATAMLVCYDDSAVYVAFECRDPDIGNALRAATETGESVWQDDSVELFFDADRDYRAYVQFLTNIDGATQIYENLGEGPKEAPISGFERKTKEYPDRWTVEFSFSYASLRAAPPRPGSVWAVQFVRNGCEPGGEKKYEASWARLWAGSTHRPELFGFFSFK